MIEYFAGERCRSARGVITLCGALLFSFGCSQGSESDAPGAAVEEAGQNTPDLSIRAGVDRGTATVGDKIRLTVEVEYRADLHVEELVHPETLGDLEVVESGRTLLRQVRGRGAIVEWAVLRAGSPGSYIVPAIELVGVDEKGNSHSASSAEVFVEILSVLPEGGVEDIRGLKPLEADPDFTALWMGLGGLVLVALMIWWIKRRNRNPFLKLDLAPHEQAFRDLEALRKVDFSDLRQIRGYYFSLSAILRRYIEGRFQLNATDLTSEEIAQEFKESSPVSAAQENVLLNFLASTDGVKYAAVVPDREQIEEVYESALGFVEETVPEEDENAPAPGAEEIEAADETTDTGHFTAIEKRVDGADKVSSSIGGGGVSVEALHADPEDCLEDERFMP